MPAAGIGHTVNGLLFQEAQVPSILQPGPSYLCFFTAPQSIPPSFPTTFAEGEGVEQATHTVPV
jgi:hypothetical protein